MADSNWAAQVVETYLRNLSAIHSAGAGMSEAAYYPSLADLLNEIGRLLQPNVRCLLHFKRIGANLPDGGLFTVGQFSSPAGYNSLPPTPPARGVIVVKSPGDELADLSQLHTRYLKKYGQVLITNYRTFLLLRPTAQESYSLAGHEAEFWREAARPQALAARHGPRLVKYLKWVMNFTPAAQPKPAAKLPVTRPEPAPPSETAQPQPPAPAAEPVKPAPPPPQTDYLAWPQLVDLFRVHFLVPKTGREIYLSGTDREQLEQRLQPYFNRTVSDEAASRLAPPLMTSTKVYDAPATRRQLIAAGVNGGDFIPYAYRPFDLRVLYHQPESALLDERQKRLLAIAQANPLLVSRKKDGKAREGVPCYFASTLVDRHLNRAGAVCFPLTLKGRLDPQQSLFDGLPDHVPANLSAQAHKYLAGLGLAAPDADEETASLLAFHVLALSYSPGYRLDHEAVWADDWPRFPLPDSLATLRKSAALGKQLSALLDPEAALPQVTNLRQARPELKAVAVLSRVDGEEIDPDQDLALTADWRSVEAAAGQDALVEREYTAAERALIEKGAASLGLTLDQLDLALGLTTYDVYLNKQSYWANIPLNVWEYTIGGHPVLQAWLASRQETVLGRPLKLSEAQALAAIARRLTAITLLGPALDANYKTIKNATYRWPDTQ